MRVLLSTIGSRGDVQPLVALASQLRALGQEVRLCVPPDFRDWIDSLGIPVTPIGPELRKAAASSPPATPAPLSPERRRQLMEATVATQFETIAAAAQGCDIIVAATALQVAARSVAERMGIPYVFAAYCPTVLPSPHHAPPPLPHLLGQTPAPATADNRELWARDAERFNDLFGTALNSHRASIGLAPVSDVRSHIFTDRPWLAADPTLAPWPDPADQAVFQTGAWILPDERPLSPELETFLETGEPPVYFGFGSMRAPQDLSQVMIQTARALGRRAIVSRGWADLSLGGQRTRLPGHRRGQPAGPLQAGRRRRPPRRRGHHNRRRARRRTPSRHPPDLRPALLGTTNTPPRHRNRARTRHTNHRLADERSRARPPTRSGCPCPIHRHRRAPRRRTGRRPALDQCKPRNSRLNPAALRHLPECRSAVDHCFSAFPTHMRHQPSVRGAPTLEQPRAPSTGILARSTAGNGCRAPATVRDT